MAGLIRRIFLRQFAPLCAGTQHPEHAVQHGPRIVPRSAAVILTPLGSQHPLHHGPLFVGQFPASRHRRVRRSQSSPRIARKRLSGIYETGSSLVRHVLAQTTGGGRAWFSLLFALWASSSATAGLIETLNTVYDLKESRPWWKYRLIAVALAVAMGVLLTGALITVMYGPVILHKIAPGSAPFYVWRIAQWPAAAVLLIVALLCLYRFAPNIRDQKWKWLVPGSIVAAVIWVAVSVLFKLYVHHFGHFGLLYGSLGTLIILMFWFYLSGIAILVGGELNAVLEHSAAQHAVGGAKRRGERSLAEIRDGSLPDR